MSTSVCAGVAGAVGLWLSAERERLSVSLGAIPIVLRHPAELGSIQVVTWHWLWMAAACTALVAVPLPGALRTCGLWTAFSAALLAETGLRVGDGVGLFHVPGFVGAWGGAVWLALYLLLVRARARLGAPRPPEGTTSLESALILVGATLAAGLALSAEVRSQAHYMVEYRRHGVGVGIETAIVAQWGCLVLAEVAGHRGGRALLRTARTLLWVEWLATPLLVLHWMWPWSEFLDLAYAIPELARPTGRALLRAWCLGLLGHAAAVVWLARATR